MYKQEYFKYNYIGDFDTVSSMRGEGSDFTVEQDKNVRLLDRMLLKNGYKRKHN